MSSKLPQGEDLFVERRTKRRTKLKKSSSLPPAAPETSLLSKLTQDLDIGSGDAEPDDQPQEQRAPDIASPVTESASPAAAVGALGSFADLLALGGVDGEEEEEEPEERCSSVEGSTGEEGDSLDTASAGEAELHEPSGSSAADASPSSGVSAAASAMRQLWTNSLSALQSSMTPTSRDPRRKLPPVDSHREQHMRTSNVKLRKRLVAWAVTPHDALATNARVMLRSADDSTHHVVSISSSVVTLSKSLGAIELALENLPEK